MSLPEPRPEQWTLLRVARAAIEHGVHHGRAFGVEPNNYAPSLREVRATFVTIKRNGDLRGCIGALEARRALVADVAHHGHAVALHDPRFPAVTPDEIDALDIHIAVLTPPQPVPVASQGELLRLLRPGIDGLILIEGARRATFLPAVWETLPTPSGFLDQLKRKAGLPSPYWSETLRFERYTTESFGAASRAIAASPG